MSRTLLLHCPELVNMYKLQIPEFIVKRLPTRVSNLKAIVGKKNVATAVKC